MKFYDQFRTLFFLRFLLLILPFLLPAQGLKPISIAELEVRSLTGTMNSISGFISKTKPELTGQFILATAALTMNPQTAALDLNAPLKFLLLTGAGKNAMDASGNYNPDLFFCVSAALRKNMAPEKETLPVFGVPLQIRKISSNRVLLYQANPLFDRHLRQIETMFFENNRPLGTSDLRLYLDIQTVSKIPGVSSAFINTLLGATLWDPAYDAFYTGILEQLGEQVRTLTIRAAFPSLSQISITGSLTFLSNAPFAEYFSKNGIHNFDSFHTFLGADEFLLAGLPTALPLKRQILKNLDQAGTPSFIQECIMRTNGTLLFSANSGTGRTKTVFGLEKGAVQPIEAALEAEKTVHKLPSGIWMVDFRENRTAVYLAIRENRLIIVSGRMSAVTAKKMIDETTMLPKSVILGKDVFAHFKKLVNGSITKKSGIRYESGILFFSSQISTSDFPQKPSEIQ